MVSEQSSGSLERQEMTLPKFIDDLREHVRLEFAPTDEKEIRRLVNETILCVMRTDAAFSGEPPHEIRNAAERLEKAAHDLLRLLEPDERMPRGDFEVLSEVVSRAATFIFDYTTFRPPAPLQLGDFTEMLRWLSEAAGEIKNAKGSIVQARKKGAPRSAMVSELMPKYEKLFGRKPSRGGPFQRFVDFLANQGPLSSEGTKVSPSTINSVVERERRWNLRNRPKKKKPNT
jgi:hypothetical protein